MKVSEQTVDGAKGVAGVDEEAGCTGPGAELPVARAGLEHTNHSGPDRDHTAPTVTRLLDRAHRDVPEHLSLLVHGVILDALGANRSEGREPDVEPERCPADSCSAEPLDDGWREMQAGCRGGGGIGVPGCVCGLVPLRVVQLGVNVWGERRH